MVPRVHVRPLRIIEPVEDDAITTLVDLALHGVPKDTDDEDESRLDFESFGTLLEFRHHESAKEHGVDDVDKHACLHALGLRPRIDHETRVTDEAVHSVELLCYIGDKVLNRRIARHI